MSLPSLSVRTRLSLAFGSLAVLVTTVSGIAAYSLDDANSRLNDFAAGATLAGHVEAAIDRRAIAARNLVLIPESEDPTSERNKVMAAHEEAAVFGWFFLSFYY